MVVSLPNVNIAAIFESLEVFIQLKVFSIKFKPSCGMHILNLFFTELL